MSISPDGHTLYVAGGTDNGVALFRVAPDGKLAQLPGAAGCITLDGKDNFGNPSCAAGRGLRGPFGTTISPDARTLYVIADLNRNEDGVAAFSLDPSTGAATPAPGPIGLHHR